MPTLIALEQAPRLAIAGIKTFKGMDGQGLNADLYLDRHKIGEVLDEGRGGEMFVHYQHHGQQSLVRDYLVSLALPATILVVNGKEYTYPTTLETLVNAAVDQELARRQIARLAKRSVVFRLPEDATTEIRHVRHQGNPAATRALILQQYPSAMFVEA